MYLIIIAYEIIYPNLIFKKYKVYTITLSDITQQIVLVALICCRHSECNNSCKSVDNKKQYKEQVV